MTEKRQKWTPGPWRITDCPNGDEHKYFNVEGGEWVVARVWADEAELEAFQGNANARLIAAAPEMYAALEAIAVSPVGYGDTFDGSPEMGSRPCCQECADKRRRANAALRAAEGGQP